MEREYRAPVGTFYVPGTWDSVVRLPDAVAHHAAVKRLGLGDVVQLTSGDGRRALGVLATLTKREATVQIEIGEVEHVGRPPEIELLVPVADRERMLWLAEKSVELGVSGWRPVTYARSRSVSPRGEGDSFRDKVIARQISAMEQSGGAWLPHVHRDANLTNFLAARANGPPAVCLLLDGAGNPIADAFSGLKPPIRVALGPEGGLEASERNAFLDAGWRAVSLGSNVLRFETAAIAALAILRSHFS